MFYIGSSVLLFKLLSLFTVPAAFHHLFTLVDEVQRWFTLDKLLVITKSLYLPLLLTEGSQQLGLKNQNQFQLQVTANLNSALNKIKLYFSFRQKKPRGYQSQVDRVFHSVRGSDSFSLIAPSSSAYGLGLHGSKWMLQFQPSSLYYSQQQEDGERSYIFPLRTTFWK